MQNSTLQISKCNKNVIKFSFLKQYTTTINQKMYAVKMLKAILKRE
jgi:hypothetical protein